MNSLPVRLKHTSNVAAKSFDKIFSPKAWPIIGHGHLFIPKIGKYSADIFSDEIHRMMKEHGVPIIKLILNGQTMVFTISAEDTRTMYQNEGKHPLRNSMEALDMLRRKNGQSVGVIASNGVTWHKMRAGVNPLLKKPLVTAYYDKHKHIAQHHIRRIAEEMQKSKDQVVHDVTTQCMRFTLDAISVISPVLSVSNETERQEALAQNMNLMDALYRTMGEPPIWGMIKTKAYRQLELCNNYFYNKISSNIKTMDVTREPFLKILFELETLSYQDKVITAMDIFLGGIDATATTLAMTLHYLSLDRGLQDRIVSELTSPPPDNTRFIKACIRETLRMSATAGGNARCMQNEVIISGYLVPKGTWVLSLNPVIGTLDSYFDFAHQYRPQRWLRQHRTGESTHKFSESTHNKPQCDSGTNESTHNKPQSTSPTKESTQNKSQCVFDIKESTQHTESTPRQSAHPFASLPFGFGPRMCPGKLVAEQEMVLYLTEILQTFILEPVDKEPLGMIFRTNRVPDRIINIKCVRR